MNFCRGGFLLGGGGGAGGGFNWRSGLFAAKPNDLEKQIAELETHIKAAQASGVASLILFL